MGFEVDELQEQNKQRPGKMVEVVQIHDTDFFRAAKVGRA